MKNYFEAPKPTLIYVFRIDDAAHADCLKVGETCLPDNGADVFALQPNASALRQAACKRINQYTQTAGIAYELLYAESAVYLRGNGIGWFNDKEVHKVLLRSGIRRKDFKNGSGQGTEWFVTDLETVKRAIRAVKEGRSCLTGAEAGQERSPVVFRPEQREAIDKTVKRFKKGRKMLWNAKMRFGKTLSALQVVKEMRFRRTLILTHRPVVDSGWFEDFGKIFRDAPDYLYGSKTKGEPFAGLESLLKGQGKHYVYFASMQDLRGSEAVGGKFDKNDAIFSTPWDLIIVDEAHEGTQTALGKAVTDELAKAKTRLLHLSGTPFNLLDDFDDEEIYTWDYVMEQRAKAAWDKTHFGDPNPYAGLPRLNIYTYDLGRLMSDFADEDIAFNFREFFRTNESGGFIHERDVSSFLNLLSKEDEESMYPFANDRYRAAFRHTLWMVPGVRAAKALSAMLQQHPVFQHFRIVNVAGDGDAEEENRDALRMVNEAIGDNPDETRTITLSCGRLTTGVSVRAWTGVLMLSGSYNTAASAYMQTIFRVQTPATINGRMKEDCYVFDFAPDRTLQVLATVPRVSTKAGGTTDGQKRALGDFLNFCPVIAVEGGRMEEMNVTRMLQQLKKAYVERVVRNGFEDACLYNDSLLRLTDVEIREFKELKGIIGQTRAIGNTGRIDVNRQGLTNEEYEDLARLEKKKKKELTDEERAHWEELERKAKIKEDAVSILRGISIRMPLLIYGADIKNEETELTIDNFTQLIDAQSWEEFMPRGVTKQKFNAFKKYYDPEIFSAAGKRIRALTRAADRLRIEERIGRIAAIFHTFRNPDKETVLTPWPVVNMHVAASLGGFSFYDADRSQPLDEPRYVDCGAVTADVFSPASRLLEINSKSGLYPLYLAYSIYRSRLKEATASPETLEEHLALWDKAVAENVFVICKTPMAKSITRRTLMGFRRGRVNTQYVKDLIDQIKNDPGSFIAKVAKGHSFWKANENDKMKFKAIVGNPPYQVTAENTSDAPVYNYFMDVSFRIAPRVTLITPARYLFNAGKTPQDWNDKMLNDPHFKVVWYKPRSTDVFPNVDIKGGVAVTFRDAGVTFGKIGAFTAYPELNGIYRKVVENGSFEPLSSMICPQNKFNLDELYRLRPDLRARIGSNGNERRLTTSIFALEDVFLQAPPKDAGLSLKIIGLVKNKRECRWVDARFIAPHPNLMKWKVIVPKSNGTGAIGEILSTPIIGEPIIGYTQSFIGFGAFDTRQEAEAVFKYIRTKLCRTMLGILKVTQDNSRETWRFVPMQDFSQRSDIDWTKSVAEIDAQLYAKYGLSEAEISFIESMIRPM